MNKQEKSCLQGDFFVIQHEYTYTEKGPKDERDLSAM